MWCWLKELLQVILGKVWKEIQGGVLVFFSCSPSPSGLVFKQDHLLKKAKPNTRIIKATSQIGPFLKAYLLSYFISSSHSFWKPSLPASFQDHSFLFLHFWVLNFSSVPWDTGLVFYSVCRVLLTRGCLDKVSPKALSSFFISAWQFNCSERLEIPEHGPFQPELLPDSVDLSVRRERSN